MANYFKESMRKFETDALSKGIYDVVKWLVLSLILIIPTQWIPYVKTFFGRELKVSFYLTAIFSIILIAATSLVVSRIFRNRIKEVLDDNHTDELTGMKNHKALSEYLINKIREFKNKEESLSIIILDVDDFKNFNTEFGFNTADLILKKLGQVLANDKRATDETFRYFNRGDEFLVVAGETNLSQAIQAAERKRRLIQKNIFSVDRIHHQLTVCCGVTEFKKDDNYTSLTDRVIEALNEAKKVLGKNNTKSIS